jgi:phosphopantothenoylcysteine decarboxylase
MSSPPKRVLVGASGSVAGIKTHEILQQLSLSNIEGKLITTPVALSSFLLKDSINCPIYQDSDEWSTWTQRGDPVLHIEVSVISLGNGQIC